MAEKRKKAEKAKAEGKKVKKVVQKVKKAEGKEKEVKKQKEVKKAVVKEEKQDKKEVKEKKPADKGMQLKAYEILKFPLITEKAVNMIEAENKLVFIVNQKAGKGEIRKAVESLYGVEVDRVNIIRDMKSRKRAIVKINKKYKADDIATKLGVL